LVVALADLKFGVYDSYPFGGYRLALAALALVVFGAYDSYPVLPCFVKTSAGGTTTLNLSARRMLPYRLDELPPLISGFGLDDNRAEW